MYGSVDRNKYQMKNKYSENYNENSYVEKNISLYGTKPER